MFVLIALFLTLPVMAIALTYGFVDAGWTSHMNVRQLPVSLGAFILYSYAVLCSHFYNEHLFFSYVSLTYITLVWGIGFYYDLKKRSIYLDKNLVRHPVLLILLLINAVFVWFSLAETSFYHFHFITALLMLSLFPLACTVTNQKPLRLWKFSVLTIVLVCFFIEIPDFTDVLYAVTALYIAYVLEGERQATFGVSGSFVLGGLLAFWILTVVEQPYQIFILVIPLLALIFSLQPTVFEQLTFLRWIERIGLRE
ncbi:hypothetical protein JCM19045_2942 [Bacillus sp. JCM 19045]|nr:hypothetical protein JCM19045_2942 [Bacillus sp. JCM 19045]